MANAWVRPGPLCAAVVALGALAGRADALPLQAEQRGWAATPVRGSGEIEAIAQTPDGLLWLGDRHGLRRYDGFRLEIVADPALIGAQRFVRRLFVGAAGGLWVATGEGQLALAGPDAGGLVDWRGTTAGFYHLVQGRLERPWFMDRLPSPWVWALAQGANDTLWIGTEGGLVRVHQGTVRVFGVGDGLPHPFVTALQADGETLWVGTAGGLARLRGDRADTVIPERPVFSVVLRGPGRPVIATSRGIFALGEETLVQLPLGPRAENLVVTRDGDLWGTTWGRLWRHGRANPDTAEPVVIVEALDRIAALIEDREGSVWAASRLHGLVQLRASPAEAVPAVSDETPFSVLAGRDGELWVVTTKRVLALRGRQVVHSDVRRGPRLPTAVMRSLAQSGDGRVWVTGREDGLMELTADGWRPHRFERQGRARSVESALGTRDGALWVAWLDGGLSRFPGANMEAPALEVGPAAGLCPGRFGPIIEARDGALWAGSHETGVAVLRDGRWQCLGTRAGLPSQRIAALYEDVRGDVYVGSLDAVGLAVIRDGVVRAVIDEAELGPGRVFGMAEDRRGGFWISSDRGVAMVPKTLLAARVEGRAGPLPWRRFEAADGLPSETCMSWFWPSMAQTADGLIWVPTLAGLVVLDPARLPPPVAARLLVDQIKAAGQPVYGDSVSLDPDRADLEVRYTAPTFLASSAVTFEHRLIGFDRSWVDAGQRREVHYASLPPGHYQLAIRVLDAGHPMGEPALLQVEVRRRFWQRPAVVALALAVLALSLLLGHRLRMRQVEARYSAVQDDRARIARDLHDGLAQGLTSVGLHLDALRVSLPDPANPMREVLLRARAILDRVQSEARLSIWNLRAQSASRVSVADALARVVAQATLDGGAHVTVSFRAEGPELARSGGTAALEHELPHVVEEAITNALRHGAATRVRVVLRADPAGVRLTITDDGTGFDPAAPPPVGPGGLGGFGIVGMQERAQRLGGKLDIRRTPEGGMEVTVSVPQGSQPERSPYR